MITRLEIERVLRAHCLVQDVAMLRRGHLRVGTKLSYLDGSGIDLFVEESSLSGSGEGVLSDFGESLSKLAEYQVSPKERTQKIQESLASLRVKQQLDRLYLKFTTPEELQKCVIDLSQACARVSCLSFTRHMAAKRKFKARVDQLMKESHIKYEPRYDYTGPYEKPVRVDYRTLERLPAAILVLGHRRAYANEVFRKWSDLDKAQVSDRRITIFDDAKEMEFPEDLERIEGVSEVVGISSRSNIYGLLGVAA